MESLTNKRRRDALATFFKFITQTSIALLPLLPQVAKPDSNGTSLKSALLKVMQERMVSLTSEVTLFRYESGGGAGAFYPLTLSDVQHHIMDTPDYFFEAKVTDGNLVGPGLYASVDPIGSRTYGSSDPQLYVFTLRKSARVVNAKKDLNVNEKLTLLNSVGEAGCLKKANGEQIKSTASFDEIFGNLRNHNSLTCRIPLIEAVNELRAEAILYPFSAATTMQDCSPTRSFAINIINKQAIEPGSIALYNQQNRFESIPKRKLIAQLYSEVQDDVPVRTTVPNDQNLTRPLGLGSGELTFEYIDWKRKKVFACGDRYDTFEQSPINDLLISNIRKVYGDKDLGELIVKVIRAFSSKFSKREQQNSDYTSFSVSELRAFKEAEYKAIRSLNPSLTYQQYLKAMKLLSQDDDLPKRNLQIQAILSEAYPDVSADETEVVFNDKMREIKAEVGRTDYFLNVLHKVGFGIQTSILISNRLIVALQGIPFLADMGAVKTHSVPEAMHAQNKSIVMGILKHCLDLYSDATTSYEQIQIGECRIEPQVNE